MKRLEKKQWHKKEISTLSETPATPSRKPILSNVSRQCFDTIPIHLTDKPTNYIHHVNFYIKSHLPSLVPTDDIQLKPVS